MEFNKEILNSLDKLRIDLGIKPFEIDYENARMDLGPISIFFDEVDPNNINSWTPEFYPDGMFYGECFNSFSEFEDWMTDKVEKIILMCSIFDNGKT